MSLTDLSDSQRFSAQSVIAGLNCGNFAMYSLDEYGNRSIFVRIPVNHDFNPLIMAIAIMFFLKGVQS